MTVTVVSSEPAGEEIIPPADTAATEVVETAAAEAAVVTAEASIALAEAEAAAVTLRSEDEIRQLIGGLETWRVEVGLELSALNQAVQELKEATALMSGLALAQATSTAPLTGSEPPETVEVETPTAAVTITEPPDSDENIPSVETKRPRRWT